MSRMVKMKDGSWAKVGDDWTDADIRKAGGTVASRGPVQKTPPKAKEMPDSGILSTIRKYTDPRTYLPQGVSDFMDSAASGLSLHADANLAGLTGAATKLARTGSLSQAGDEFNAARARVDQEREARNDRSPIASTAGEISGSLLNPVGARTGVGSIAQKLAPSLVPKAGGLLARAANSSVGLGARAGFNQGAIEGAMDSRDGGVLGAAENALNSGTLGAGFGGAFGGALGAGGKVINLIKDHAPESGARIAYEKIAQMLGNARDAAGNKLTPEGIAAEIRTGRTEGTPGMVADYSPEMQAAVTHLARRPNSEAANELNLRSELRADEAGQRFEGEVNRNFNDGNEIDAYGKAKGIRENRKAAGARDYTDEVMDKKFVWNDRLEKLVTNPTPTLKTAMEGAANKVRDMRGPDDLPMDPTTLGFKFNSAGEVEYMRIPSMRTFDALKRSFDDMIGDAMSAGKRDRARVLSAELNRVKDELVKHNPDYRVALANQRDLFQQETATEFGKDFITRMRGDPAKLLDEMKGMPKEYTDNLKYGIADALVAMTRTGRNPVGVLRNMMRNSQQRKVLEQLFDGDRAKLNRFDRFLRRELTAGRTDRMANMGKNSVTSVAKQAGEGLDGAEDVAVDLGRRGLTGGAFGGVLGAIGNTVRGYQSLKGALSSSAKDELTRILMGEGDDLASGIRRSEEFMARREAARRRYAERAGKAAAGLTSGYAGN